MYAPAVDDELTTYIESIDQELEAIRASAYGLSEEQARSRPCRSELTVATILTHTVWGMESSRARLVEGPDLNPLSDERVASFYGSFTLAEDVSVEEVLSHFDTARAAFLAALREADPAAEAMEPPAPWEGRMEPAPIHLRFYLAHLHQELSRHAGHADIIREQVDGMQLPALVMSRAGVPADDYFTPFVPAEGTIAA